MPTIGVASILITPQFKDLQKTVGRELDGAAASAGKSSGSKMGKALGTGLKIAGAATVGAAGTFLGVALTKGFGRLQAIENAKAKLTGLGHSAKTVEGIMANATAAVKGTAFGLGDAAGVAAGAVAAGIKPGKELQRTLTLMGDAATIAGTDLGSMGSIFNKVAASGKLQGDVIAQLQDAGVPVLQFVAKEIGKTASETSKLASEGKIDFETFQKAMTTGLGGAAQASGKTLQGAFANTMAAVGRIGANLLSGVYPKIQAFFSNAIDWLKPLEDGAKVAGKAIGDFLDKALTGAQGLYDLLVKGDFTGELTKAFGWAEDSAAVDFLMSLRDSAIKFRDALPGIIEDGKKVAKFLWDMRVPIGIISGLILTALIPYWIELGFQAIKSAVKQKIAWGMAKKATLLAGYSHIKTVATMIGGWVLLGVQATIQAVKIAAAWLIAMGPIGWIIGGIALLVGGFILAYNKLGWFKDGVNAVLKAVGGFFVAMWEKGIKPAFGWIVDALKNTGQWFKDVWDGAARAVQTAVQWIMDAAGSVASFFDTYVSKPIQVAVGAVAAVFTWLYETIIKPVFDSISVIAYGFYLGFRGIFQLVVSIFQNIIAPAFMNFWHGVIEPVFAAIGLIVSMWWTNVKNNFNAVITFIKTVFSAVFTWFRDSVITPVFNFIRDAIATWWRIVSGTFNTVITFVRTVFSAAFTWLRDSVITPVFNFIKNAISTWWTNVKNNFNAVVTFLKSVFGPAFTWLRDNVITPVWNNIKATISDAWNKGIKPIFDFLHDAITKTLPKAFQTGVDAIKRIWNTILDIAKAPVRFVINTVINDGLIGAFNKIAGILPGIDKLPRVALPKGFASGGWTGPGSKYQPAGIVHADEFVVNKAARRGIEGRAPGLLDALNNMGAKALGMLGYANGGRVWPTKSKALTQGYTSTHDGIDIGVPTGTPVFATANGAVDWAGPGVQLPGIWGGNEIHIMGGGLETWFGHLSQIGVKLGQQVKAGQQIGLSGNTGITSGPHLHFGVYNGGYPNSMNPLAYLSGAGAPSGGSGGGGWLDPLGFIRGLAEKVVGQVKAKFPAGGFMIDAVAGVGKKLFGSVIDWAKGKLGMGATAGPQHGAHLNPLLYDQGGVLRPGLSSIVNATGRPEAILNPQQWADIHHLATVGGGGGRGDVIFNGPVGWNPDEVANRIETKRRDTFAAFGI